MPKNGNIPILLVDDDEIDIMAAQRAFKQAQMPNPVIVASDGVEALSKMRDGKSIPRPHLILLDLNMPRMGGLEFLKEVRKDDNLRSSVIFVLTTSSARTDQIFAYQYNIAGYILKSMSSDRYSHIADLIRRYFDIVELPIQ